MLTDSHLRSKVDALWAFQEQFALLMARQERLRAVQRESLRQSEHLFHSLLNKAFEIN